jgi:glutaminyl-peptide cyclotransferase
MHFAKNLYNNPLGQDISLFQDGYMSWSRNTIVGTVGGAVLVTLLASWAYFGNSISGQSRGREHTLATIPFNGERAYAHLTALCEIGPRISDSPGMLKQQELLTQHFEQLGGKVSLQSWEVRHPETGAPAKLANLIVQWHPDRKQRVLLCTHYDTRPYPDEDPNPARRRDPFLGANDGTSGVALLMELSQHMPDFKSKYGVDFVMFDAEEFIFEKKRDPFFLGSEHFARMYVVQPPEHKYRYGVLLDMIGDKNLQLFYEKNSMDHRETRAIAVDIWARAKKLGVNDFISKSKHEVNDDHLALINIAKIPTCDLIDFDYRSPSGDSYWHTTHDTPANCSPLSLAKVGWVLHEWLKNLK